MLGLVMRMANRYTPYRHYRVARSDGPYCYMEVVKKAGLEYDALSHEKATEYLSLLKERCDYRLQVRETRSRYQAPEPNPLTGQYLDWFQTGTAMVKWENTQLASRAREIAAEKDTRFER